MNPATRAYIFREGGKFLGDVIRIVMTRPRKPPVSLESEGEAPLAEETTITSQTEKESPEIASQSETKSPIEGGNSFWLVYVTPEGKWGAWDITPTKPTLEIHKADPKKYFKEWGEHYYRDAEAQVERGRFAKYWISEAPTRYKAIENIKRWALPELESSAEEIVPVKPEEECPTCAPLTDLQQFLERRKVERALSKLEPGEGNEEKKKSFETVRKYIEGEDIA